MRDYQRRPPQTAQQRAPSYPPRRRGANVHVPERKRANPFIQSGIKKYKEYELEDAIEDFNKGLEISPGDIALHFNIACAYSLTEQLDKALFHLDKAVEYGFTDLEKIRTHDALAYVRIQPVFESFAAANFRLMGMQKENQEQSTTPANAKEEPADDKLLEQLQRLADLRDKGLITEQEFMREKEKLLR